MKAVYSLSLLCCMLALCHGSCFNQLHEPQIIDGKLVQPDGCVDVYDGTKHLFGSEWNTANCMKCTCSQDRMNCCTRYGGIARIEGCTTVVDPKTCKHKFYKKDNPSEPC